MNQLYRDHPALWEGDYDLEGFYWIDCSDHEQSVLSFIRADLAKKESLLIILNLTPIPRSGYRIGLPHNGHWDEVLNSDAGLYGGGNVGNYGGVAAEAKQCHSQPYSGVFTLPPLGILVFKHGI